MTTSVHEIADGIFRLSTLVPGVGPTGLTYNQFLIRADQPLLFHCGQRALFAGLRDAVARVLPPERLRWLAFSHVEADECGALDQWLALAPEAVAVHGRIGCATWLSDVAARPPRALADGEVLDLGGRRVRRLDTPHLPHGWDAGLMLEETTGTLFTSDLFTRFGPVPAESADDIVGPAIAAEDAARFTSLTPDTPAHLRRLAALAPRRLALMHGPAYTGDGAAALSALADHFEARLRRAVGGAPMA